MYAAKRTDDSGEQLQKSVNQIKPITTQPAARLVDRCLFISSVKSTNKQHS